eukprot:1004962-Pleurochrysis_carterae.AAC.5
MEALVVFGRRRAGAGWGCLKWRRRAWAGWGCLKWRRRAWAGRWRWGRGILWECCQREFISSVVAVFCAHNVIVGLDPRFVPLQVGEPLCRWLLLRNIRRVHPFGRPVRAVQLIDAAAARFPRWQIELVVLEVGWANIVAGVCVKGDGKLAEKTAHLRIPVRGGRLAAHRGPGWQRVNVECSLIFGMICQPQAVLQVVVRRDTNLTGERLIAAFGKLNPAAQSSINT